MESSSGNTHHCGIIARVREGEKYRYLAMIEVRDGPRIGFTFEEVERLFGIDGDGWFTGVKNQNFKIAETYVDAQLAALGLTEIPRTFFIVVRPAERRVDVSVHIKQVAA